MTDMENAASARFSKVYSDFDDKTVCMVGSEPRGTRSQQLAANVWMHPVAAACARRAEHARLKED